MPFVGELEATTTVADFEAIEMGKITIRFGEIVGKVEVTKVFEFDVLFPGGGIFALSDTQNGFEV